MVLLLIAHRIAYYSYFRSVLTSLHWPILVRNKPQAILLFQVRMRFTSREGLVLRRQSYADKKAQESVCSINVRTERTLFHLLCFGSLPLCHGGCWSWWNESFAACRAFSSFSEKPKHLGRSSLYVSLVVKDRGLSLSGALYGLTDCFVFEVISPEGQDRLHQVTFWTHFHETHLLTIADPGTRIGETRQKQKQNTEAAQRKPGS